MTTHNNDSREHAPASQLSWTHHPVMPWAEHWAFSFLPIEALTHLTHAWAFVQLEWRQLMLSWAEAWSQRHSSQSPELRRCIASTLPTRGGDVHAAVRTKGGFGVLHGTLVNMSYEPLVWLHKTSRCELEASYPLSTCTRNMNYTREWIFLDKWIKGECVGKIDSLW